ncbi:Alpha/Beta hydrolase protein [Xylariaceae sp. FL1019]|nr:Alpha/Beta hydrolase protein [Xylariaceae sp. FL1019]
MLQTNMKVDPQWSAVQPLLAAMPRPQYETVHELRAANEVGIKGFNSAVSAPEGVAETKHTIQSVDGSSIDVYQMTPNVEKPEPGPQRAVVYAFGGGMVSGSVELWSSAIKNSAKAMETQFFAVDYRLAPEHAGFTAIEDCYSTVKWLQAKAADFNVDPKRIVLYGHSAGGLVCAGTSLMARDKGLQYPLAAVVLMYPMLDDRTVISDDHPMNQYLVWTMKANKFAWEALLGNPRETRTDENVPIYAAPGRAKVEDLSGLPDHYIDVGGLDLFAKEDIAYASKLAEAEVNVEFHLYPGVPHGFDGFPTLEVAGLAVANQVRFIKSY